VRRQDNLLVKGGFKQGAIWSKEKWSLEVKGVQGVGDFGSSNLKASISLDFEAMKVKFKG
jgi:hypothetical protein